LIFSASIDHVHFFQIMGNTVPSNTNLPCFIKELALYFITVSWSFTKFLRPQLPCSLGGLCTVVPRRNQVEPFVFYCYTIQKPPPAFVISTVCSTTSLEVFFETPTKIEYPAGIVEIITKCRTDFMRPHIMPTWFTKRGCRISTFWAFALDLKPMTVNWRPLCLSITDSEILPKFLTERYPQHYYFFYSSPLSTGKIY